MIAALAAVFIMVPALLAGCSDDTGGITADADTKFGDIPIADVPNPDSTNPNAVRKLEFESPFGDDQIPCRGTTRCTISLSFGEKRTLKVVYTEDGAPTSGQVVKFSLEQDPDEIGRLNTLSSVTGPDGLGSVETNSLGSVVGQYVVKAWVDNSDIPPLYFDCVVTPKGQVPLTVVAKYAGTRVVPSYTVNLYRQDNSNSPGCDDLLDLLDNQTASQARDNVSIQQSAKFPSFDDLDTDLEQRYTILAFSKNENGAIQAWGCDDEKGVIKWTAPTTVTIDLVDRPPLYVGAYNITSLFDFISAIPEPYRMWVDLVVSFFQEPIEAITRLVCQLMTDDCTSPNSFCDLIYTVTDNNEDDVCEFEKKALFSFVEDLLQGIIDALTKDTIFGTIFTVGGDIADVLKAFEIKATLTFNKEPDDSGVFAQGDAEENWHTVTVKWSLGANCDPVTDENCGLRTFGTNVFQQAPITGTFGASVADFWNLTIDPHPLSLNYGALINYFLESLLLPLVTGEDQVDSYEELIGFLVSGGTECLADQSCCAAFGERVDGGGSLESAAVAACSTISSAAPGFLRNTLEGLDVESGSVFTIGTKRPCLLHDLDGDLIVDRMGGKEAQCVWDVQLRFSESATTTIESTFWGLRAE